MSSDEAAGAILLNVITGTQTFTCDDKTNSISVVTIGIVNQLLASIRGFSFKTLTCPLSSCSVTSQCATAALLCNRSFEPSGFRHAGQGSTAPSAPLGAEPSAPAGRRMAGGSPLHLMTLPEWMYYIAQKQWASPLSIRTLTGGWPQVPEGPVEPCRLLYHQSAQPQRSRPASESCAFCIKNKAQSETGMHNGIRLEM